MRRRHPGDRIYRSGNASSEASSSPSEDAKPEKYVVGVPTLLTGAWAELGIAASNGIKLALEDVNAEGGIHGIPVELEIMDTASDNAQAVDVAKKLIEDNRIIGIASADGTGNSIAAMPYYEEAQMVFISSMASSNSFAPSSNYAFTCSGMVINEVQCTANMLGEFMGAKKVAMVYVNSDWGASFVEGFGDELAKYGAELVACESYNDGEKDFSALLTKIRQTEPDALFIAGQYADTAAIVNTIKQMNWDVIFTGTGAITNQQFMDLVGDNAEGMLAYSATVWTEEYPFAVELSDRYYKAYGTYRSTNYFPLHTSASPGFLRQHLPSSLEALPPESHPVQKTAKKNKVFPAGSPYTAGRLSLGFAAKQRSLRGRQLFRCLS